MRPSRFLFLLVVALSSTGCSRCAGIEEDKPKESVQEVRGQGRTRFRLTGLNREGGINAVLDGGLGDAQP